MRVHLVAAWILTIVLASGAQGAEAGRAPAPPAAGTLADWPNSFDPGFPGAFRADALIERPAGRAGPVRVEGGRFVTADGRRLRFLGVNVCFGACFPTHEQADEVAARLARLGVNIVRFHHMDNRTFPNGIFADDGFEKLSPEALDRLDYFIAALKKNGIYTNLNLHVSRNWARAKRWPNADRLQSFDKLVDLFHPELIEANKAYARDLLTHVNAYTKARYADEPAVAMVEINNEDTLFLWGGDQALARLPEPYAGMLQKLWNQWLVRKYGTRQKLAAAWAVGAVPLGENLLRPVGDAAWVIEQHEGARATVAKAGEGVEVNVSAISGTSWHVQYSHPRLKLREGERYTLTFKARSADGERPREMSVAVAQAHAPWNNLGLASSVTLGPELREHRLGFVASADDDDARVSFSLGWATGRTTLTDARLRPGGLEGLRDDEDPAAGTVRRHRQGVTPTPARAFDWYAFVQHTDQSHFVMMRDWLRKEIGVKAPITGTIGLGPAGTMGQAQMDFVDAHAYWDHPHFPRRPWDGRDWLIHNRPMVDDPAGSALFSLAAVRVAGRPFTVTEYNHAAPNEWQAECVPMLAAFAAAQDWDAVFLFSYSHSAQFRKDRVNSYFDVEGNPWKLAFMPLAARMMLGDAVRPARDELVVRVRPADAIAGAERHYESAWSFLRSRGVTWRQALGARLSVAFTDDEASTTATPPGADPRLAWTAGRAGERAGRFTFADERGAAFVGFAKGAQPIAVGPLTIERLDTPFAALMLVPADASQTIESADRLLLAAMARGGNKGMTWDESRRTVSDRWGTAPPQVEVVKGRLSIRSAKPIKVKALGPDGKPLADVPSAPAGDGRQGFEIGTVGTVWYEIVR